MRTLIFCGIALIIGLCCIWYPVINETGTSTQKTCEYVDSKTCLIRSENSSEIKLADISHLEDKHFQVKEQVVYELDTPIDKSLRGSVLLVIILTFIILVRFCFPAAIEGFFAFFMIS